MTTIHDLKKPSNISTQAAWCLLQGMQAKHLPTQYATSALMKSAAQAILVALQGAAKSTVAAKVRNVGNPAINLP